MRCACFTNDTEKAKNTVCQWYGLSDYLQVAGTEGSFQSYYGNQYITKKIYSSHKADIPFGDTFLIFFFIFYFCDHGIKFHILEAE